MRTRNRHDHGSEAQAGVEPVSEPRAWSPRLERIVVELESIVLGEGFLHLTVDELARRLRCSKRSLYQLAGTREELFDLVIDRWLTRLRAEGRSALLNATNPFEAVIEYLNAAIPATRRASPEFVRDLMSFPSGHGILMRHQAERIGGLERLIQQGVEAGAFRDVHPKLLAEVLLVVVAKLFEPELLASAGLTLSEAFKEFYEIFEFGLRPHYAPERRRGRGRRRSRRELSRSPRASQPPRTPVL